MVFATYGSIAGMWSGSIPAVVRRVGVDEVELGILFTLLMAATVLAMSLGGWLSRYASYRTLMLVTAPCMLLTGLLLLASTSRLMFVPSLLAFGMAQGLLDLAMNSEGTAVEGDAGRPVLTTMHGIFSVCFGICALLGSLISVRLTPLASAPILIAAGLAGTLMVWHATPNRRRTAGGTAAPTRSWVYGPLVLLGLAVGFENAGEIAGFLWSAKLLDQAAPALAAISGIGPAFFAGCSAIVRLNGDRIRAVLGDRTVVVGSMILAAIGLLGVGVADSFAAKVAAFAVVGLGTACITPCLFAIAARSDPNARAARLGFVSMIAGIPRITSPMIFGWVWQHTSAGMAFGFSSVLMIAALVAFVAGQATMMRTPEPARL
jgi:cyanate permease